MATWDDLRRIALASGGRGGRLGTPGLASQKQVIRLGSAARRADVHDLGATPPDGPIVSVYVAGLGQKEPLIATETPTVFVTPHFDRLSGSTGLPRRCRRHAARGVGSRRLAGPCTEAPRHLPSFSFRTGVCLNPQTRSNGARPGILDRLAVAYSQISLHAIHCRLRPRVGCGAFLERMTRFELATRTLAKR